MCIKKYNYLILFFTILTILIGCKSTQVTKKDSIPVSLDVSEDNIIKAWEYSVYRYFRRYNTELKDDGKYYIEYGSHTLIFYYDNGRIYVESSIPEKHPIWLSHIYKIMQEAVRK